MVPFAYTELTVTDVAAAKEFYAAAFGWQFTDYGPGYAGIRAADGSGEQGGLAAGGPVEPGTNAPLVLLEADDLEATHTAVTAAGGTAEDIVTYPGGRRFVFTDPSGNRLGVFRTAH